MNFELYDLWLQSIISN